MGSKRRRRGSGGHPAKVAARRERDRSQRKRPSDPDAELAASICRSAEQSGSALEIELLLSNVLGFMWGQSLGFSAADDLEQPEMEMGVPLVEAIARCGGVGGRIALAAISALSQTELADHAAKSRAALGDGDGPPPPWAGSIGRGKLEAAAVMGEEVFDDGRTIWFDARYLDGDEVAFGVYIDHNLGHLGKDLVMADSIEQVREVLGDEEIAGQSIVPTLRTVDLEEAIAEATRAIALTDRYVEPPVNDDYPSLRAFALRWLGELPAGVDTIPDLDQVSEQERDRLFDDFLASEEAASAGITEASAEAEVVLHAIGFASDYVDGRPLRWSPVVVELFVADWFPRKVVSAGELAEHLPPALSAWLRYVGRVRELPEQATAECIESIDEFLEHLSEAIEEDVASPATMLLRAAQEAGVDLSDRPR